MAAERSAAAVETLLKAGATLVGKTITDEISLGLLGINRFYGTPLNPRAPDSRPWRLVERICLGCGRAASTLRSEPTSGGSVRVARELLRSRSGFVPHWAGSMRGA